MSVKYSALAYSYAIATLERLISDETVALVQATAPPSAEDESQELFDALADECVGLYQARAKAQVYAAWDHLRTLVRTFHTRYPSAMGGAECRHFALQTAAAEALLHHVDDLDAQVSVSEHEIIQVDDILALKWHVTLNAAQPQNSFVLFDSGAPDDVVDQLRSSMLTEELAVAFVHALAEGQPPDSAPCALVRRDSSRKSNDGLIAWMKIVLLASGTPLSDERKSLMTSGDIDPSSIQPGLHFHQWNDAIASLAAFRRRENVLLKFLAAYQLFELLMVKAPIARLQKRYNGNFFSIRHFRDLHRHVDQNELQSLTSLFGQLFDLTLPSQLTVRQSVWKRFKGLTAKNSFIDRILAELGTGKPDSPLKTSTMTEKDISSQFAQVVYRTRCAIVHHKETEFFLSDFSVDDNYQALLDEWILPSLEEIAFATLGAHNDHVWYSGQTLSLYS